MKTSYKAFIVASFISMSAMLSAESYASTPASGSMGGSNAEMERGREMAMTVVCNVTVSFAGAPNWSLPANQYTQILSRVPARIVQPMHSDRVANEIFQRMYGVYGILATPPASNRPMVDRSSLTWRVGGIFGVVLVNRGELPRTAEAMLRQYVTEALGAIGLPAEHYSIQVNCTH